ncbi:MAG: AI-2E family transporter [Bacteroidales bacterium]|nr:AI-2E family transporter [Bacteroidales bacterium]
MNTLIDSDSNEKRYLIARKITYFFLVIILFIYGLIAIRNFLYPVAFGLLFAYLLYPMARWLEKKKLPRILANMIVIIGSLAILGTLILFAYRMVSSVASELPELFETGIENLSEMLADIVSYFGFDRVNTQKLIQDQSSSLFESSGKYLETVFNATSSTIVAIGLMPVYIFLFLYYRTKFMYFLIKLAGNSFKPNMIGILRETATVMVQYISGVFIVVLILCVINSLGLWIIGLKHAIALGIIAALFNFIPYFGTLLGGIVPLLFAFLIEGNPGMAFRVVLLFIFIQFIENNLLTPNIVGGNVKINPFFVITGLFAASMVWGIPGMLLVVPFLAIMRIIFSYNDALRPYAFLLGNEGTNNYSITLSKIKTVWSKKKQ